MESIFRLRSCILNAIGNHGSQQELFDELRIHRPQLLKLFDVGKKDAQEQREIESGALFVL